MVNGLLYDANTYEWGKMSDNKVLEILNQLDCNDFDPRMQPYPLLLGVRKVCNGTKDPGKSFDCICNKVEDLLMGEVKKVLDEYLLDDDI